MLFEIEYVQLQTGSSTKSAAPVILRARRLVYLDLGSVLF